MKKNKQAIKSNSVFIVRQLLKIPGVKVSREAFLLEAFTDYVSSADQKAELLEKGPTEIFNQETVDKIALKKIKAATKSATLMSFVTGIPGGFAILGTLPADTVQIYATTLKLAQELSYIYGSEDIWYKDSEEITEAEDQLLVYLGVMMGVNVAASATRMLSNTLSKTVLEKLPNHVFQQTVVHHVAKKTLKLLGLKSSKKALSQGLAKVIPLAGGIFSGGLTYFGIKPMGYRLQKVLSDSVYGYDEEQALDDIELLLLEYNEERVDSCAIRSQKV